MPQPCPICHHPDAGPLLADLLSGHPYRTIAAKYSVRLASISLHVRKHLNGPFRRLALTERALETDAIAVASVRQEFEKLHRRLERIWAVAESKQDLPLALQAAEQIRRALEVLGKITGEIPLAPSQAVQVNNQVGPLKIEIVGIDPKPWALTESPADTPGLPDRSRPDPAPRDIRYQ